MRQTQISLGRLSLLLALSTSAVLVGCGGGDDDKIPAVATAASVCAKLNGATGGGVAGLSATVIAASAPAPTSCKVTGTIPPQLGIEIEWHLHKPLRVEVSRPSH